MEKIGVDRTLAATKLRQWLDALKDHDVSRAKVAEQVPVTPAALYKWQQADGSLISLPYLVRLLTVLRKHMPKEHWDARIALDWATLLGYTWDDINQTAEEAKIQHQRKGTHFPKAPVLIGNEKKTFLVWWAEAEPSYARQLKKDTLPELYVERKLRVHITAQLARWMDLQKLRYQGVVLWGPGGIGKTTIANAIALDRKIQQFFHDGILWIDAQEEKSEDWAKMLCKWLHLGRRQDESWLHVWQQWAKDNSRRCLLIIDDVDSDEDLLPIIEGLGSQILLLITTQRPRSIERQLLKHIPPETIWLRKITELEPEETQKLVAQVIQKPVKSIRVDILEQLREQLGWSPETVFLAAYEVKRDGWTELQAAFLEGDIPDLATFVQRHLERIRNQKRQEYEWLLQLMSLMKRRWSFGAHYSAAVWDVPICQARRRLHLLTHIGVLLHLEEKDDRANTYKTPWQIYPWIYARLKERSEHTEVVKRIYLQLRKARVGEKILHSSPKYVRVSWPAHLLGSFTMVFVFVKDLLFLLYLKVRRAKKTWQQEQWEKHSQFSLIAVQQQINHRWLENYGVSQEYWLLQSIPYRHLLPVGGLSALALLLFIRFTVPILWKGYVVQTKVVTYEWVGVLIVSIAIIALLGSTLLLTCWYAAWHVWILSQQGVGSLPAQIMHWVDHKLYQPDGQ